MMMSKEPMPICVQKGSDEIFTIRPQDGLSPDKEMLRSVMMHHDLKIGIELLEGTFGKLTQGGVLLILAALYHDKTHKSGKFYSSKFPLSGGARKATQQRHTCQRPLSSRLEANSHVRRQASNS